MLSCTSLTCLKIFVSSANFNTFPEVLSSKSFMKINKSFEYVNEYSIMERLQKWFNASKNIKLLTPKKSAKDIIQKCRAVYADIY